MPRFYFDLREGESFIEDEEGLTLPDLAAAEREARRTATEIADDRQDLGSLTIEVRDRNGDNLLSVAMSVEVKRASLRSEDKGQSRSGDNGAGAGPP
jgi:hypothetical protein